MATFQSRDEVIQAYRKLLDLEKTVSEKLDEGERVELKPDDLSEILESQSEIMSEIEDSSELDRQVRNSSGSRIESLMKAFSQLRQENRRRIQQFMEQFQQEIDSLDQAHDLLKHYLQGERRSGSESSLRIDREA